MLMASIHLKSYTSNKSIRQFRAKGKLQTGTCNNRSARKAGRHMHHNNSQRQNTISVIQQIDTDNENVVT